MSEIDDGNTKPIVGVPVNSDDNSEDVQDDMWSEESDKAVKDAWEKIRLAQPNQKLPNSFFERNKLYFLSLFDAHPRVQWLLRKIQFINIILALGGLYLLVCFLFPILIQLGYASACYDEGLDYVMKYHKCFEPLELNINVHYYPTMSKYDVLFQSINLDYGRELDADISDGNRLRDVEAAKLNDDTSIVIGTNLSGFVELVCIPEIKPEEEQLNDVENLSEGVVNE